jgi:histone deacetylase 1/2
MLNKRVSYIYEPYLSVYYYKDDHPMKPERIKMTHDLIVAYGLYKHMDVYTPIEASKNELTWFHSKGYIECLENKTVKNERLLDTCK